MSSAGCSGITADDITAAADNITYSADNITDVKLPPEVVEAYNRALTTPLNKAADEVKDPDLARFTKNLIASYSLGTTTPNTEQNPASLVPDIKKITRAASDNMLIEAGKSLKDKELAEFYDSFIKSIGAGK
ncbi:MAG: hypothetical protein A2Z02_07105 [Chloroflexi bacterium RBG_16_48_7]|nr:MAG: hypothetical protein A2Z02_07105 [Chloroflexi bacterium RBG_16_48_7]